MPAATASSSPSLLFVSCRRHSRRGRFASHVRSGTARAPCCARACCLSRMLALNWPPRTLRTACAASQLAHRRAVHVALAAYARRPPPPRAPAGAQYRTRRVRQLAPSRACLIVSQVMSRCCEALKAVWPTTTCRLFGPAVKPLGRQTSEGGTQDFQTPGSTITSQSTHSLSTQHCPHPTHSNTAPPAQTWRLRSR
jgi:hypothetical protein